MGNKLYSILKPAKVRVVILGLDAAGKTTVIYQFKTGRSFDTIPTTGFNVEKVKVSFILIYLLFDPCKQQVIHYWQTGTFVFHGTVYSVLYTTPAHTYTDTRLLCNFLGQLNLNDINRFVYILCIIFY